MLTDLIFGVVRSSLEKIHPKNLHNIEQFLPKHSNLSCRCAAEALDENKGDEMDVIAWGLLFGCLFFPED